MRIELWVEEIRAGRFTVAYELFDGDVLASRARSVCVPFDLAEQRPRRLSDAERAFLRRTGVPTLMAAAGRPSVGADAGAFLARLVRLDPAALVRLRPAPGPGRTALWALLPCGVLVTRTVAGTGAGRRHRVGAADLLAGWPAAAALPRARDAAVALAAAARRGRARSSGSRRPSCAGSPRRRRGTLRDAATAGRRRPGGRAAGAARRAAGPRRARGHADADGEPVEVSAAARPGGGPDGLPRRRPERDRSVTAGTRCAWPDAGSGLRHRMESHGYAGHRLAVTADCVGRPNG